MPLECGYKQRHGRQFCVTDCPASEPGRLLRLRQGRAPEDLPASDPRTIDVAVLDMNHGWPNLGHDSLVHAVMDAACDVAPELLRPRGCACARSPSTCAARGCCRSRPGRASRSTSAPAVPATSTRAPTTACGPSRRASARTRRGRRRRSASSTPCRRDEQRGAPRASATPSACCAAGRARRRPVLRGPEKGKCSGVLENVLTWDGAPAPLVPALRRAARTGRAAARGREPPVRPDPAARRLPRRAACRSATRRCGVGGAPGEAVTMIEFARDRRRRDAPHLRGQPPSGDRRPLPADDDPRPEARPRRGERASGTASGARS